MKPRLVLLFLVSALITRMAGAASVFVQWPDPPGILQDPVFVTATGPSFFAEACICGPFKAMSTAPAASAPFYSAYSGILEPLAFSNTGTTSISLPAGALGTHVTGAYALGCFPSGRSSYRWRRVPS